MHILTHTHAHRLGKHAVDSKMAAALLVEVCSALTFISTLTLYDASEANVTLASAASRGF